jgi:hypothetical protein
MDALVFVCFAYPLLSEPWNIHECFIYLLLVFQRSRAHYHSDVVLPSWFGYRCGRQGRKGTGMSSAYPLNLFCMSSIKEESSTRFFNTGDHGRLTHVLTFDVVLLGTLEPTTGDYSHGLAGRSSVLGSQ